jgi:uncharacterized protein
MRTLSALAAGLVFGAGIAISGMADPAKVLNFFDLAGTFDPSLVFVMFSAMLTAMAGYRFVLARNKPLYDDVFHLPPSTTIDKPLVLGAATFGIGWGIAGFCPGGAIPALGLGSVEPLIFVLAMEVGMVGARFVRDYQARQRVAA